MDEVGEPWFECYVGGGGEGEDDDKMDLDWVTETDDKTVNMKLGRDKPAQPQLSHQPPTTSALKFLLFALDLQYLL